MRIFKKYILFVIALVVVGTELAQANAKYQDEGGLTWNLNFFYGKKELEADWGEGNTQDEFGVELDFGERRWPIHLVLGYRIAVGEGQAEDIFSDPDDATLEEIESETETTELYTGIKAIFGDQLKISFAGGVSLIRGEFVSSGLISEDDSTLGAWGSVSVYVTILNILNVGASGRYSYAPLEIGAAELDAGGVHYNVFAGFNF